MPLNQGTNKSEKMTLKNQNKFKITNKLIDKAKNIGDMKRDSSFIKSINQISTPININPISEVQHTPGETQKSTNNNYDILSDGSNNNINVN